ncbi:hypothetical protein DHD08_08790 [Arenibacter sp. H213]|nr:hypothetical protein [Arenibacter sp. H213]
MYGNLLLYFYYARHEYKLLVTLNIVQKAENEHPQKREHISEKDNNHENPYPISQSPKERIRG